MIQTGNQEKGTRTAPLLLLCLLCLGAAKSSQLMVKVPAAAVVVIPPPNTNTYTLTLGWDASAAASGYHVWLGSTPAAMSVAATATNTTAPVKVPATNANPWFGVTAFNDAGESDMSQLLTRTNYLSGRVAQSSTLVNPVWIYVPGTSFTVETGTNGAGFFKMMGVSWNNLLLP